MYDTVNLIQVHKTPLISIHEIKISLRHVVPTEFNKYIFSKNSVLLAIMAVSLLVSAGFTILIILNLILTT